MNKAQAASEAKKLIKRKMSAYGGPHTMAVTLGLDEPHTPAAFRKVRKAFLEMVLDSSNYDAMQKIYAKEQLAKMAGIKI